MSTPTYLFSIDLEDVRMRLPEGDSMPERCPAMVRTFLEFLGRHDARCTFFTLGQIARAYPDLLREIRDAGHEVACHSSDHVDLDKHDEASFREDITRCLEDFAAAGIDEVKGFRAPRFSMTARTPWAYRVLDELGFTYSSSVVVAPNPIHGWPDFRPECIPADLKIREIPMTLSGLPGLNVPYAGGVYFRVLPAFLVRYLFRRDLASGEPVTGYFHPYDADTEQERCDWPELGGSRLFHWLIYKNRDQVFPRLEQLMREGARILPYVEYLDEVA